MRFTPAFSALLDELERFELPPRHRLHDGETVGGKVRAAIAIRSATCVTTYPPLITSTAAAVIWVRASAVGTQPVFGKVAASIVFEKPQVASTTSRKGKTPRRSSAPARPRPKRSAEAIAASASKIRAQRQARVAAVLPLVQQARDEGCVFLSDIARYLDQIGHKPPQGERWSVATLCKMLPREQEKRERNNASIRHIEQAKAEGASSLREVANWMNAHGYRTARDKVWTRENVDRFIRAGGWEGSSP